MGSRMQVPSSKKSIDLAVQKCQGGEGCRRIGATMARGGSQGGPGDIAMVRVLSSKTVIHSWFGRATLNSESPGGRYLRLCSGPRRHQYLHRAVWEAVAGFPVPAGWVVHHMRPDHCCPESLVALEACLHVHAEQQIRRAHVWTPVTSEARM